MGGNIPSEDFLGGNFPGRIHQGKRAGEGGGWSLIAGNFPGGNFPDGSFPDTVLLIEMIMQFSNS